jgi:hypothetical protein
MNPAVRTTCQIIEQTLSSSPAYRRIDERLFVVKQGSTFVMINALPWGSDRAVVRCVAQLVKGVELKPELSKKLLEMNAVLRFGAFAYVTDGDIIVFGHSILGGATLDPEELVATVRDVALVADEYDDRIARRFGGQTMAELLEQSVVTNLLESEKRSKWEN